MTITRSSGSDRTPGRYRRKEEMVKLNENETDQKPNPNEPGPLPEMETAEDAIAVAHLQHDQFYICAFMMKRWLARLVTHAAAVLPAHNARHASFRQTGQAWSGFLDNFGKLNDQEFHQVISHLTRFIRHNDLSPRLLLRAHAPLEIEQQITGDFTGRDVLQTAKRYSEVVQLMRRTAERLCDWLDATIHLETYGHRRLSQDQLDLRVDSHFAAFGHPLCRLPEDKRATGSIWSGTESWPHRELDTFLIALQPLAKRYRWSCGDMLKVLRKLVSRPQAYLGWSETDVAWYRREMLALPPLPDGETVEGGLPAGFHVAVRVCPPSDPGQRTLSG